MTFIEAIQTCLTKYVTFSGRASRSEFWWFVLFSFAASIALSIIDVAILGGYSILSTIFSLAILLPSISVAVRRLHDTDRVGWWYWIVLIPLIGIIVLIVFFAQKGTDGDNRFGADPLGGGGNDGFAPSSVPPVARD